MGQHAMMGVAATLEEGRERYRQGIPLKAIGEPDDIAYAVVYLASDESKYVTGPRLSVGGGVTDFAEGDRVAYAAGPIGAYARHRNVPAARLIAVPDGLDDEVVAATLMKGMTVEYLLNRAYKVKAGEDVLFYAASGGVGQLAGQWGRHLGARMIGVTSGEENCRKILDVGYADAIDRNKGDIAGRVRELTGGRGVSVVFDSVGKATFEV